MLLRRVLPISIDLSIQRCPSCSSTTASLFLSGHPAGKGWLAFTTRIGAGSLPAGCSCDKNRSVCKVRGRSSRKFLLCVTSFHGLCCLKLKTIKLMHISSSRTAKRHRQEWRMWTSAAGLLSGRLWSGPLAFSVGVVCMAASLFQCRCALVGCAVDRPSIFSESLPGERLLAFLY